MRIEKSWCTGLAADSSAKRALTVKAAHRCHRADVALTTRSTTKERIGEAPAMLTCCGCQEPTALKTLIEAHESFPDRPLRQGTKVQSKSNFGTGEICEGCNKSG